MDHISSGESPNGSPDHVLAGVSSSQGGVFTRAQALSAGLTVRQIEHRLHIRRWAQVLPSVYRVAGGAPPTLDTQAIAATLWAGRGALVSHATAAVLWAVPGVRHGRVEIWLPPGTDRRSKHIDAHRGTSLDVEDATTLRDIPITTATRTLIDVAGRLEDDALLAALEDLIRRGLTSPEALATRLAGLPLRRRPGVGRLAEIVHARNPTAAALESRLEARFWLMLERSTLPAPARQHWVVVNDRRYRLDFAWLAERVAVECDGWQFHGGRDHFERDELRRADLASAGWRVIPVTWRQCTSSPAAVLATVGCALQVAA